jgi:hypothetical protein
MYVEDTISFPILLSHKKNTQMKFFQAKTCFGQ